MSQRPAPAASCPLLPAPALESSSTDDGELDQRARQRPLFTFIKARKSNGSRDFRPDRGAELINCLSEFLASKNVINRSDRYEQMRNELPARTKAQTGSPSSSSKGKKVVSLAKQQKQRQQKFDTNWQSSLSVETNSRNELSDRTDFWSAAAFHMSPPSSMNGRQLRQQERVKKFAPDGQKQALGKKCGVYDLLKELLSGRRRANKLLVLTRLLKAPVVLAALFSFFLALSLIVLYTLSFHHCQQHSKQLQLNGTDSARPHSINSRHLTGSRVDSNDLRVELIEQIDSTNSINERSRVVQTECGSFEARDDGPDGLVFSGIPYASPPVEQRRWQRPRPIWLDAERCKKEARRARNEPAREHCAQLNPFNRRVSGAEDCLYLDIYAPKNASRLQQLPVMLYIHGGFLAYGSSGASQDAAGQEAEQVNWLRARPSGQLASELNVLLVGANFRLQALGFMALEQLAANGAEPGAAANFGLWDQLVALRWLGRNIGAFGGDPANINLFGPDSASALPLALASRSPAPSTNQAATSKGSELLDGHLPAPLRSVWLMNPSLYFELPRERANLHYARLIKSQSICSSAERALAGAPPPGSSNSRGQSRQRGQEVAIQTKDELDHAERRTNLLPKGNEWHKSANKSSDKSLRDCLMSLPASELVREYLGQDLADFRLDDQNSLPIRNIYPDQFVTLDGELVRRSFPFEVTSGENGDEDEDRSGLLASATKNDSISKRSEMTSAPASDDHHRPQIDFLLGSSAQAVEFWPCPRNLHNWTWLDFERYVETSLNSFSQDTFRRAAELYKIPTSSEPKASLNWTGSPVEAYLTLVSDIRQMCPASELASELAKLSRGQVGRYVIEWRPSERLARSFNMSSPMIDRGGSASGASGSSRSQIDAAAPGRRVEYAFHQWDLLAFFGFHFEQPALDAAPADLAFQRQLRAMVRAFVWRPASNSSSPASASMQLLFDRSHRVQPLEASAYRKRQCQMWQQTLKQSYAWLS